ncbi:MAG: succinate dehydrogenase cytochrome b subunit [Gemmataceae bacterium]|nr:succinate dehydrogenase cytochrome b subunit [Gemmataceae bacterium]
MTPATGPVRHPKGPAEAPTGPGAGEFLRAVLDSTVGGKVLVALTGLGLVGFVVAHLIGNLKLFEGPEAINHYAYVLKHDFGLLLWFARGGLLAIFLLHLFLAIRLKRRSAAARPVGYAHPASVQAGVASRTMLWTGLVILLFVVFHLAHYTFGVVTVAQTPNGPVNYLELRDPHDPRQHNVYEMTVAGFRNPAVAAFYLACQVVLFLHLRHGIPSTFQTLGLKNARFRGAIDTLGLVVALFVLIGNCSIVAAVLLGYVPSYLS